MKYTHFACVKTVAVRKLVQMPVLASFEPELIKMYLVVTLNALCLCLYTKNADQETWQLKCIVLRALFRNISLGAVTIQSDFGSS